MKKTKNAVLLTDFLKKKLSKKYVNPLVSYTKTKRFLKDFCAVSYKNKVEINSGKLSKLNFTLRE